MMEMRSMDCEYCGGTGVIYEELIGIDDYVSVACPYCKGTGIRKPTEVIQPKKRKEE